MKQLLIHWIRGGGGIAGGIASEIKFLRCGVKPEVEGCAKPMFGFVLRKEYNSITELKKIIYTIVKFQLGEENKHM